LLNNTLNKKAFLPRDSVLSHRCNWMHDVWRQQSSAMLTLLPELFIVTWNGLSVVMKWYGKVRYFSFVSVGSADGAERW